MFFLSFLDRNKCGSKLYGLRPLIACLPAWWRFAQSLRRYNDTKQKFPHVANAGKYATTFFVVFFSTVATTNKGTYHLKTKEICLWKGQFYLVCFTTKLTESTWKYSLWWHPFSYIRFVYCSDWSKCGFEMSHPFVCQSDLHRSFLEWLHREWSLAT